MFNYYFTEKYPVFDGWLRKGLINDFVRPQFALAGQSLLSASIAKHFKPNPVAPPAAKSPASTEEVAVRKAFPESWLWSNITSM